MGKINEKIVKVEFFVPVNGKKEYYFGSQAAIYEVFTPQQIGCKLEALWKAGIEEGKPKSTLFCVIFKHKAQRKFQKNSNFVAGNQNTRIRNAR